MLSERVKPFKWKPFDLYNDVCIERYRKINSPPIKSTTKSTINGKCCDNFGCNRDHYFGPPPPSPPPFANNNINPKSFLFGAANGSRGASDNVDDRCESNRKSNEFCERDKFADVRNDNDTDNDGINWPTVNSNKYTLSPNVMSRSRSQLPASAFSTGSVESSCGSSTTSSLSPNSVENNCNTNKVDNKIDALMFRRSIDSAPPIVYGPLPYSKFKFICVERSPF